MLLSFVSINNANVSQNLKLSWLYSSWRPQSASPQGIQELELAVQEDFGTVCGKGYACRQIWLEETQVIDKEGWFDT